MPAITEVPHEWISAALWIGTLLYAAIAIDTSSIHTAGNADTLLSALVSLVHYTPFYWSQNRFGMLLPLVALPVRDLYTNYLFQSFLTIFAALVFASLVTLLCTPVPLWTRSSTILKCQLLTFLLAYGLRREQTTFDNVFLGHPHMISLCLGVGYCIVAFDHRPRTRAGPAIHYAACMLLNFTSVWVAPDIAILLCLIVLFGTPDIRNPPGMRGRLAHMGLVVVSWGVVWLWAGGYGTYHQRFEFSQYWVDVHKMLENIDHHLFSIRLLAIAVAAALAIVLSEGSWIIVRRLEVLLVAGSAFMFGLICSLDWVRLNGDHFRYTESYIILAFCAAGHLILSSVTRGVAKACGPLRATRFRAHATELCVALSALTIVITTAVAGFPSRSRVFGLLDGMLSPSDARAIRDLGCTHLVGNYWRTWPAVFWEIEHRGRGALWAVTTRSAVTEQFWQAPERRRYCA